ncbi:hypothetical protein D3C85_638390 [compost metagenome]
MRVVGGTVTILPGDRIERVEVYDAKLVLQVDQDITALVKQLDGNGDRLLMHFLKEMGCTVINCTFNGCSITTAHHESSMPAQRAIFRMKNQ